MVEWDINSMLMKGNEICKLLHCEQREEGRYPSTFISAKLQLFGEMSTQRLDECSPTSKGQRSNSFNELAA